MPSFEKFPSPLDQSRKNIEVTEAEKKKSREKELEVIFEEAIEFAWKVNEGNNGIVCLFEMDKAEEHIQKAFFELNERIADKGSLINKILKIYHPGEGMKEFSLQKEFWQTVENHPEKDRMMKIPEPFIFKEIPIKSKSVQKKLDKWGFKLPTFTLPEELKNKIKREKRETLNGPMREVDFTEKELEILNKFVEEEKNFKIPETRLEMFLMDNVEFGEDLATIFYQEVIKNHPGAADWGNSAEGMGIDQMQDKISQIFDFKRPGGKHVRAEDRIFEDEMVKKQNASAVRQYLIRETDFTIDKDQFEKIERTINFLNGKGLFHRDLHERNIMFDKEGEVYLVDFGSAKKEDSVNARESVYEEGEKIFIRDKNIVEKLKIFTNSQEKRQLLEKAKGTFSDFHHLNKTVWREGGEEWNNFMAELDEKKLTSTEADNLLKEKTEFFFRKTAGKGIGDFKEIELRIEMFLTAKLLDCLPEENQAEWAEKHFSELVGKCGKQNYLLGKVSGFRYWFQIEKGLTVGSGRRK